MISWSEEVSKTESVTEFEPELHQKIAKLLNIKPDKVDSTDFEVSQYINELFPDEKSIENIDEIYSKVTNEINEIDRKLLDCYKQIIDSGDKEQKDFNYLKELYDELISSVETTMQKTSASNDAIHETLSEVENYSIAKNNISYTLNILNNIIFFVESSKKLLSLLERNDFDQIAILVVEINNIMPSLQSISHYREVTRLTDEYNTNLIKIKEVLSDKICYFFDDFMSQDQLEIAPLFACASKIGPEFQNVIIQNIGQKITIFIDKIFSSFISPTSFDKAIEYLSSHIDLIQQCLKKMIEMKEFSLPSSWRVDATFVKKYQIALSNQYAQFAKSCTNFDPNLFIKVSSILTEIDQTINKRLENAEIDSTKSLLFINNNMYNLFEEFHRKEFQNMLQTYNSSSTEQNYLNVFNNSKQIFSFFKKICTYQKYFPDNGVCYKNFQFFTEMIDLFMNQMFNEPLSRIKKLSLTPSYNEKFEPPKSFKNYLFSFSKTAQNNADNAFTKSQNNNDWNYKKLFIKSVGYYLVALDYCFDTTENLETFLRNNSPIDQLSSIDFSRQTDQIIEIINDCVNVLKDFCLSECYPALKILTTKMWYEVDEGARQSNYVTVLIQSLKKAVKEVRQGLDLSRHHFITVCKNIVLKVPDMIIDAVLNFHKGITMQQAPGQRLLADSRFIGQYLINIPLLDSDLSSHQLPPDFVTFSNKSVKKFLSILKFMLIEMVDTDIKAMALNFEKIVGESVEESSMVKILKWKGINPSQVNEIISEILKME